MAAKKETANRKAKDNESKEETSSYYFLKAKWSPFPRLLNRTFLFRTNGSFEELDRVMRSIFDADIDHLSCFEDESGTIVTLNGFGIDKNDDFDDRSRKVPKSLRGTFLNSKDEFFYRYDFGDNYLFRIKAAGLVKRPGKELAYVLKGKGEVIWEDEIGALYDLLSDQSVDEEDECFGHAKSIEEFAIDIEPYVYDDSLI